MFAISIGNRKKNGDRLLGKDPSFLARLWQPEGERYSHSGEMAGMKMRLRMKLLKDVCGVASFLFSRWAKLKKISGDKRMRVKSRSSLGGVRVTWAWNRYMGRERRL